MQHSNVFSFWQLIKKYHITIPIIQRDYAQGRKGKDVHHVRNEFLRVLFNALQNNKPIELDFIYGTVNEANQFAPLDGQQRLTTLFLLHWYYALKEGQLASNQEVFQNFSYETRLSSKLFCKLLISLTDLDLTEETLSKQIYNEANFYYSWAHDPTVSSMLTMIDTIHEFSNKYNLSPDVFEMLTSNSPITFQFIDLDSFQLEDTLYIKMNARGKPLTPFENFKARLQQYLENVENVENVDGKAILHKTDTVWSDFFWKYQKESYDESFLQFLFALLYNQLARNDHNRDRLFAAINRGEIVRFDELEHVYLDSKSWIIDIDVTLDMLCNGTLLSQETVIDIKKIVTEAMKDELSYTDRVQLHAMVSYIRLYNDNFTAFKRWMRFVRNVSVNTIYNRVEDFIQSIQSIDVLVTHAQNLNAYLVDNESRLSGFLGSQLMQEQLKAQLILQDNDWEEILSKAEDYEYFGGDIGFLLQFINGKEFADWSSVVQIEKQNLFESYYKKAIAIFGPTSLNVPINLFSRALLTFGDYLIQVGQNRSFLIEGFDRDISWKRFLRHEKVHYLKQLLDEINSHTLKVDLERIVNGSKVTDWRQYFINYPFILEKRCGKKRLIRFYDEKDILLLDTTMTSGYCQEYYSYAIYAALKQMGVACNYQDSVGAFNEKYVELNQNTLNFVGKQFYIYDENDHVIAKPLDFDGALEKMCELAGVSI